MADPVDLLLVGAKRTIARARSCWLATASGSESPGLRPMGRLPREPGDDDWTSRFVTDGRSQKAADIRRAGKAVLVFQEGADEAFVALTGRATLVERESEVRRRWKKAYDPFFPTETDRANAAFLTVEAERLELWIRGVTPEPFGLRTTRLDRDAAGAWRLSG
jgi:general stress protein 26